MNGQPLRPHAVAVEPLLEVMGVLRGRLLIAALAVTAPVLQRGRLIHVVLADVVAVHGRVVDVQLQLTDPAAVPVAHVVPLDEKLTQRLVLKLKGEGRYHQDLTQTSFELYIMTS